MTRRRLYLRGIAVGFLLIVVLSGFPIANAHATGVDVINPAPRPLPPEEVVRAAHKKQRLALVIGNNGYPTRPLVNPVRDATEIWQSLQPYAGGEVGFDLAKASMDSKIDALLDAIGADPENPVPIVIVYYAGHAFQFQNENYLLPIDFPDKPTVADLEKAIPLSRLMRQLSVAGARNIIVILDACRTYMHVAGSDAQTNQPDASNSGTPGNDSASTRSLDGATNGLARFPVATGSLISYATGIGNTADDGDPQGHSPYTRHLLKNILLPLLAEDVLTRTSGDVAAENPNQVPWVESQLNGGRVYIRRPETVKDQEYAFYLTVMDTPRVELVRGFLALYGETSEFAGEVKQRLAELEASKVAGLGPEGSFVLDQPSVSFRVASSTYVPVFEGAIPTEIIASAGSTIAGRIDPRRPEVAALPNVPGGYVRLDDLPQLKPRTLDISFEKDQVLLKGGTAPGYAEFIRSLDPAAIGSISIIAAADSETAAGDVPGLAALRAVAVEESIRKTFGEQATKGMRIDISTWPDGRPDGSSQIIVIPKTGSIPALPIQ
jgi:hypothetical protein